MMWLCPPVSEESPTSSESGVHLSQDPSSKPVLLLPPKKPAAFSGDHEDTPVKQLSLLKQPPALPPKPIARIANHLAGKCSRIVPSLPLEVHSFLCFYSEHFLLQKSSLYGVVCLIYKYSRTNG